jgi:outer membrane protein
MFKKAIQIGLMIPSLLMGQSILDSYIQYGLENNLALRQHNFSYRRSVAALNEARGMFLPSVSIEARYTRAGGGRVIDFPVGDLLNPVYSSLNNLLGVSVFPTDLPNEHILFLREEEHETKLRLIQPIFQPGIFYNYRIQNDLKQIESFSRDVYVRQLVVDIKTAYFNYLKADRIVLLLTETESLLEENVRVSQSLFKNNLVTQDAVFRAEAELYGFKQQQAEAEKGRDLAAGYFNFLLNRPLDSSIETIPDNELVFSWTSQLEADQENAIQKREELKQIEKTISVMKNKKRLSCSQFLPGITAIVDYGYQGEIYRFGPQDDYWMASLVGSWNLFNGFQDKYKIDQAKLEEKEMESRLDAARQQIQLQVKEAHHNLVLALKSIDAALAREKSAQQSFAIVEKQFREGMVPHISFIDARNAKTQAEVNAIVTRYDYWIRLAEWEKITAGFDLYHATENCE